MWWRKRKAEGPVLQGDLHRELKDYIDEVQARYAIPIAEENRRLREAIFERERALREEVERLRGKCDRLRDYIAEIWANEEGRRTDTTEARRDVELNIRLEVGDLDPEPRGATVEDLRGLRPQMEQCARHLRESERHNMSGEGANDAVSEVEGE